MITTKAYITKIPEKGSNIFQVNIPLMQDNVNSEALFDALLCNSSNSEFNNYHVGDCVFVDFEDDKYNTAIILGKLYTEQKEDSTSYNVMNNLKVSGAAELPADTTFGGKYSVRDIFNLYQSSGNGGSGSINPEDLKGYVQWINTERGDIDYYADAIRCMTGAEYDAYFRNTQPGDVRNNVLYFLTSVPESEIDYGEDD